MIVAIAGTVFADHQASAGIAEQPASGSTTSSKPTFVVFVEPDEQLLATVYVASDNQMDGSYYPVHQVGYCRPSTPTGGQYEYSCQPSYYGAFSGSLAPGTYYWWLRFYHRDPGSYVSTLRVSGPLMFTVPQPAPPQGAGLVSPEEGSVVAATPGLRLHAPQNSTYNIYVSTSSQRLSNGSPAGLSAYSCSGSAPAEGDYTCTVGAYDLTAGETYYWWAVIDVGDAGWIYGPRSFTVYSPPTGGGAGGGGGGGSSSGPHTIDDAPLLPARSHFSGASIKHTRLSQASYGLSKALGHPKTIAVACWNSVDWPGVSGETTDGLFTLLGFFDRTMPHWVHLSPPVCSALEVLLYNRPASPTVTLASALDTVTHEMIHALGIRDEAQTECFSMQLSVVMASQLRIPFAYGARLARLTLGNYFLHPARYVDTIRCREDGVWDLLPGKNSLPWHQT